MHIQLSHVSYAFQPGAPRVLNDISADYLIGQTHGLIGPSGAGKTTLLRLLMGLILPTEGSIQIDRTKPYGYVIQDGGLFPHLTALENVLLPVRAKGLSLKEARVRSRELFQLTDLAPSLEDRFPSQLSGGERQRVGLVRSLILDPNILFFDEPFGALDPLTRFDLQRVMKAIFQSLHKTVFIVTHDLAEAAHFCDTVTVFHEGRIRQKGTLREIMRSPADDFVKRLITAAQFAAGELAGDHP